MKERVLKRWDASALRDILAGSGMTRREAAEKADICLGSINQYLVGRMPPLDVLQRLAKVFGVTVGALLGEKDRSA